MGRVPYPVTGGGKVRVMVLDSKGKEHNARAGDGWLGPVLVTG